MTVSWLCPLQTEDTHRPTSTRVIDTLQTLLAADSVEDCARIVEEQSEVLLSASTLATLYATIVHHEQTGQAEIAREIRLYLYLLGYARCYGLPSLRERLALLAGEEDQEIAALFPLSPADFVTVLGLVQETGGLEDYPALRVMLLQELADQQAQVFDQTQDQIWLQRADALYSLALTLTSPQEQAAQQAYLYMRCGVVRLHQLGEDRSEQIERAIADLETALKIEPVIEEPEFRALVQKLLAEAYPQRGYGRHEQNLQHAIMAYTEALKHFTLATAARERLSMLQSLAELHIELREEEQARAAYSGMRAAVAELERQAREQLETQTVPRPAPRSEPLEGAVVAATVEAWLAIDDRAACYAFLVEHQECLVSDEALAFLRSLLTAGTSGDQPGYADYLTLLVQMLENAQAYSLEVAWQHHVGVLLSATEAVSLLRLAESMQDLTRRIAGQQELFTSTEMLATLYLIARANPQADTARQAHQILMVLQQIRTGRLPFPTRQPTEAESEHRPAAATPTHAEQLVEPLRIRPEDAARLDSQDPYLQALMAEMARLPPELAAVLVQAGGVFLNNTLQPAELVRAADSILTSLDPGQTPYLWAQAHWMRVVLTLDGSHHYQQALADCAAALSVIQQETTPGAWARLVLIRGVIQMGIVNDDTNHSLSPDQRQQYARQALQDLAASESYFAGQNGQMEWGLLCVTRAMALAEEAKRTGWTSEHFAQVQADFADGLPLVTRHGNLQQRILAHIHRAMTLVTYLQPDRQGAIKQAIEDCDTVITLTSARSSATMAEFWAQALVVRAMAWAERIDLAPGEQATRAIHDLTQALVVYTRTSYPQDWAITLVNRSGVYMQWTQGDISRNQEQALHDLNDVLSLPEHQTSLEIAGKALLNRSHCYMTRTRGVRTQNQNLALNDCQAALAFFQKAGRRLDEATALNGRGNIYLQRLEGTMPENLRLAIADFDAALTILTATDTPIQWAQALVNRGTAWRTLACSLGATQRGIGTRTMIQRVFTA